jgi:hypothetical protein
VSDKWRRIADRMAIELAPMTGCGMHPVSEEDPQNCPDCAIRRVYLDYLAAGGTDSRFETTMSPETRSVPLHEVKPSDHFCLPGCHCGNNPTNEGTRP